MMQNLILLKIGGLLLFWILITKLLPKLLQTELNSYFQVLSTTTKQDFWRVVL